jgi:predicted DNA-binding protein YlxM (UPF0122 family)
VDEQIMQRVLLSRLFDIYGSMLTDRQREAFSLHFLDDWSLSEVALRLQVSRQGAHDLVQRGRERLMESEDLLGFSLREERWEKRFSEVRSWVEKYSDALPPTAGGELLKILDLDDRGVEPD